MSLFFLISGALAILISFGVFENVLKVNNIKRSFAAIFLIFSCALSAIGKVNIFGVETNLCMVLFAIVATVLLFTQKSLKDYLFVVLSGLLIIAVLTFYNALNLTSFEYSYIQPYVYVALFMGIVFNYVCTSFKNAFVGTFVGCLTFELLFYKLSLMYTNQSLMIGTDLTLIFTLLTVVSYCLFGFVTYGIRAVKSRKKSQKVKTETSF